MFTLVATALVQGWELIGGIAGLIGTRYGEVALTKLGLFLILLALAGINRFEISPNLNGDRPEVASARLRLSITAEAILGLPARERGSKQQRRGQVSHQRWVAPRAGARIETTPRATG